MTRAICFGEVLWDVFPTHKKIGGAPLNVALRLNSFGFDTYMASKVGKDKNGQRIIDFISDNGVALDLVQTADEFKTGDVLVSLDESGSASYDISYPVAWDKMDYNSNLKNLIPKSDVFVFGSLICRDFISRATLLTCLDLAKFKVFDINLRAPHYEYELLNELMKKADFIKFNDEELIEICNYNKLKYNTLENYIKAISEFTQTNQICVTLGAKGAILFLDNSFYYNSGYPIKVADTVGAGDSFLASLIYQLLTNQNQQYALDFASAVGAVVASNEGANPKVSRTQIKNMMASQ